MAIILLVEDDASISRTLGEYLKSEGFSVLHADSEDGAKALLDRSPDLLLLDIALQKGTGEGSA